MKTLWGTVVSALLAAMVMSATPVGAREPDALEEIKAAYAQLVDESLPLHERLEALEGGEEMRGVMRDLYESSRVIGFEPRSFRLIVDSARIHDGNAEVELSIYADLYFVTGYSGVARLIDGRWVVAKATICALALEWTDVRCPGSPKESMYGLWGAAAADIVRKDRNSVIPITFTNGARADVVVPDLDGSWELRPHSWIVLPDNEAVSVGFSYGHFEATQPVRKYDGVVLDAMSGLMFDFGKWTGYVWAKELTERQRMLIARHLDGYTTKSGYPVLTPTSPLRFEEVDMPDTAGVQLAKSALFVDESRNPMELWFKDEKDELSAMVVITPGPCPETLQPSWVSDGYVAEERCTDGFGRIAVEGAEDLALRLLEEIRVEHYRPPPKTVSV